MSVMQKVMETVAHYLPDALPDPLIEKQRYVGQPVVRVDGRAKVTGEARFTAEVDLEGAAFAVLVCSTIPRGKVASIEAASAANVPGFLALITHANMPRLRTPEPGMGSGGKGFAMSDLPVLQDDEVRWDGQPVAVVVAATLEDAEHAASLVRVEYAPAAATISFDRAKPAARTPDAVLGEPPEVTIGERAEEALSSAAMKVDHVYRTPRYNHHAIEPHATVAAWDPEGNLTAYDTTQSVHRLKGALADVFGLKPDAVRVISAFVGGGFGGKAGLWNHIVLAAAAAQIVERPVKLALSREHVVRAVGGRTLSEQRIALGAYPDGRLCALIHEGITATTSHTRYPEQLTFPARHLYAVERMSIRQKVVELDTVANTWMRAPGESIGTFALESALDELAHELKCDPIELRRVNEPSRDPTQDTEFSSRNLLEAYRRGAERFGWTRRCAEPRSQRDGRWLLGHGVATAYYPYLRLGASARVRICADGTAIVKAPANEMGMGTATVQIQHAADRLGLPLDHVSFEYGDSALGDSPIMAGGSSQTATVVAAVQAAIEALPRELLRLAKRDQGSPLRGAKLKDVELRDGGLYTKSSPVVGESLTDILRAAGRDYVETEAASGAPRELAKYSMASYGAQFCEARVHEQTGEVRVSRWVGAFDCGRILNAKTAESQLRGGIVMGIGMALTEETLFDERRGRIVNPSLAEYHVPVNLDVPAIEVLCLDVPDPHAPLGAHGIGEIGITGAAAAIANAVFNATGKRVRELPITLDKLL